MNQAVATPTRSLPVATSEGLIKIIALYDEAADGQRAGEALVWLGRLLGSGLQVVCRGWSFASLARLDAHAAAVRASSGACVLIVAARLDAPLPPHVSKWIERSFANNGRIPCLLVALDSGMGQRSAPGRADLQDICRRWRMPCVSDRELKRQVTPAAIRVFRRTVRQRSLVFDMADGDFECRGGGINE